MQQLILKLYRTKDVAVTGGQSLDLRKLSEIRPVDRLRVKSKVLFGVHLEHLGFLISRVRPDLAGRKLDVTVDLDGPADQPRMPILSVFNGADCLIRHPVRLNSLDTERILAVVHRKHPALKTQDLLFTINKPEEGALS